MWFLKKYVCSLEPCFSKVVHEVGALVSSGSFLEESIVPFSIESGSAFY